MYKLNQKFKNIKNGEYYVIKGGFNGKYPDESTCFLMKENGQGHVFNGLVTHVKNTRSINPSEFYLMTGGHPERFKRIETMEIKEGDFGSNLHKHYATGGFTEEDALKVVVKKQTDKALKASTKIASLEIEIKKLENLVRCKEQDNGVIMKQNREFFRDLQIVIKEKAKLKDDFTDLEGVNEYLEKKMQNYKKEPYDFIIKKFDRIISLLSGDKS